MKSHNELVTQIKANMNAVAANKRAMEKVNLDNQCNCVHKDPSGNFAIVPYKVDGNVKKSRFTNAALYRCEVCGKEIDISNISQEEFDAAMNCLNRVIDIGKMKLDLSKGSHDHESHKKISKMQYKLNLMVPDIYNVVRKSNKKKKNKNSNGMGSVIGRSSR